MIGILLTGHGRFSEGLISSLDMIAGPQPALCHVNFLESDSTEQLETAMREAVNRLKSEADGVLIGCDLLGGTPFKVAATLFRDTEGISVVSGINLPAILEALFARVTCVDSHELTQSILASDMIRITEFVLPASSATTEPEEGI